MIDHDIALDPMAGTRAAAPLPLDTHARAHLQPRGDAITDGLAPTYHPGQIIAQRVDFADVNRNLLALDLGNKTGWALRRRSGAIAHGTEVFSPRASWTPGQRWQRFRAWLSQLIVANQVHGIVFERVVFGHSSASSSDVYGGFKALVEMLADQHGLTLDSVAVPTVKKHWTGSGRADKAAMLAAARAKGFRPDSDNAADALAILSWAVAQERAE